MNIIPANEPYPSFKIQCQRLTAAKKLNPELASVNAQALQQVLRRLDQAFERRRDLGTRFPRFMKAGRMRSYVLDAVVSVRNHHPTHCALPAHSFVETPDYVNRQE